MAIQTTATNQGGTGLILMMTPSNIMARTKIQVLQEYTAPMQVLSPKRRILSTPLTAALLSTKYDFKLPRIIPKTVSSKKLSRLRWIIPR